MKGKLSIPGLVLILAALIFSGCAPATVTPSPPEASPEVMAARDAALTYIREHFAEAPTESSAWVEERLTPEDVPGGATWQYTAEGWVVTVSYAVLPPEWTVYHVSVSNPSTGFEWEGRVDGSGRVPEAPEHALVARDAALRYVSEEYGQQGLGSGLAWVEHTIRAEGVVGVQAYQYTTGDWLVTISYPVVPPDQAVYSVAVVNETTGFQWEGEVDAWGAVTELGAETPEVMFDRVAARDAAMNHIYEHYHYPPIDEQAVEWEEKDITPEGLVGSATFRYTVESWVVEVSYPIVAPEAMIYEIKVTNDHLGFEWQGTVDAQGVVTEEGEAPSGDVISGEASVESIEILILESFPVQINVVAEGYLSDACTEIDEITEKLQGNTFSVTITTARPADAVCAQVITEFEEVISLDVLGLPAGTYTVDVNGVTDSFELEMDNVAPEE
jgi:hypothetical protein